MAALLVAVSRQNAHEGRDPAIVSDSLKCGIVAKLLDLDIDTLEQALLSLHDIGLVEQYPAASLRLKDIEALERVTDGAAANEITTFDGTRAGVVSGPQPNGACEHSFSQALAVPARSLGSLSWKDELLETAWLAAVIVVLSGIAVVAGGLIFVAHL